MTQDLSTELGTQSEPMKQAESSFECLKAIEYHALALATIAAEPEAWKQYQITAESRKVVIDRHENQIRTNTQLIGAEILRRFDQRLHLKSALLDIANGTRGTVPDNYAEASRFWQSRHNLFVNIAKEALGIEDNK